MLNEASGDLPGYKMRIALSAPIEVTVLIGKLLPTGIKIVHFGTLECAINCSPCKCCLLFDLSLSFGSVPSFVASVHSKCLINIIFDNVYLVPDAFFLQLMNSRILNFKIVDSRWIFTIFSLSLPTKGNYRGNSLPLLHRITPKHESISDDNPFIKKQYQLVGLFVSTSNTREKAIIPQMLLQWKNKIRMRFHCIQMIRKSYSRLKHPLLK